MSTNLFFATQVDADLKPLPVNVRVGQAVETVGQAGKPKAITGFQTHTTPVLLGVRDRAEVGFRCVGRAYSCANLFGRALMLFQRLGIPCGLVLEV